MSRHLHIISFDVPYPPNYGGVIDVYYKLFWLNKLGIKVHLHCFQYGRNKAPQLEALCEKVYYYPRKTGLLSNHSIEPYTVVSRKNAELENNLLKDGHPILFEVLHTCYLLNDPRFASRKKIFRHSNIEHEYYRELAGTEKNFFKKNFLKMEAFKLERFEKIVNKANVIMAVNQKDAGYFLHKYPHPRTIYLPSFHAAEKVNSLTGTGPYILFHGNLGISENYEAALWLISNVFSKIHNHTLIAGLNPPGFLKTEVAKHTNIKLIENPSQDEMNGLIQKAHIHVLFTPQPTGLKLKLLNVLFAGRFIVCNSHMLSGTGLVQNNGLKIADTAEQYISLINSLSDTPFSESEIISREASCAAFSNQNNAGRLVDEIFGTSS